ncbi:MAG: tRNA uridine 5-carboxymethylaminomethyl modification enzyme [Candidatus Midichloriaceae bacterium]|jgi:tRNA uridine 5-carboxymethylaminomethyl modification enzyme
MNIKYDVIVIGAGHAGIEAASASARVGAKTCLITKSLENLGELSCNPSIGGVAKGIIVKEVDALGGIMGKAIDKAGIHFKILNKSKGPAVWGPRAQADRDLYKKAISDIILNHENLDLVYEEVDDLIIKDNAAIGVISKSGKIFANSVIITTGTFLNGVMHIGKEQSGGGRAGEAPSKKLAITLKNLGLKLGRLKTGTPARINKSSIQWDILEKQMGDKNPQPFSEINDKIMQEQIPCYITYTNEETHEIVKRNKSLSPILSGQINSIGPRYCPSIEDKITRFHDKNRHQIFLEPEGLQSDLIYPNGISTSLPKDIQEQFIKSIKGLEHAKIENFGYVIEYDFLDPRYLKETLESKKINNLYFAGQINGTTGYEEAAGQGLIAGANAALKCDSKELILTRENSYIGVMINDLTTFGTQEPYRMMTSRAEYRIKLRADNAIERLSGVAESLGMLDTQMLKKIEENKLKESELMQKLKENQQKSSQNIFHLLNNKDTFIQNIQELLPKLENVNDRLLSRIISKNIYKDYEKRLEKDIEILNNDRKILIPKSMDFSKIAGISNEIKEKLNIYSPKTVAEIKQIQGITPTAVIAIILYIKKQTK